MASINLYKSRTLPFLLALHVFHILCIYIIPEMLWPWKYRSRSRCTTFSMAPFDGKCLTSYLITTVMFAISLTICEIITKIIKCKKFWPWKWRSRSNRTLPAPLDWKCSNPHMWFFSEFLDTWKQTITPTGYTHTYTHAHTHTVRDKGDDYWKNLQICLKTKTVCTLSMLEAITRTIKWSLVFDSSIV